MKNPISFASLTLVAVLSVLAGCSTTPSSVVYQPTSVAQGHSVPAVSTNGAIFQTAAYRPLFEDRRARMVGDTLTIAISESTSAVKASASSASKDGKASFKVPSQFGFKEKALAGASVETVGASSFENKGAESASNTFTGNIGVTVAEVLPNGNLLVTGEKQIALDKGVEFVRFSGVVRPDSIAAGNLVPSAQVAEARLEYRTNSRLDRAEMTSMVSRFFQSMLPF